MDITSFLVPIYKDVKRGKIVANYFKKVLVSNKKGRSGGIENCRGCVILISEEGRELDLPKDPNRSKPCKTLR